MDPLVSVVLALAALIAGLALGWFAAARQSAPLRAECDQLRARCGDAEKSHAAADERAKAAELLRMTLSEVTVERDEALRQLSEMRADARNFESRMKELLEAKEALTAQFHEIGAKLLTEAQKHFLDRADARFNQASEKSEAQLKALLQPVEATLKRYEEGLTKVEKERVGSYEALREAVTLLHAGHTQVRDETARLVNALRSSPKARGRWGEQSLKNVLEQAGLSPYADFRTEVSVDTADGRLRPDVVVRLPGGRKLIIDAKCSLNAFLDASEAADETARAAHLKAHAASIRSHAQQLGSKNYWEQFGDAADYVILYIPGEHFLTAALEQDDRLWEWSFERRVLLATPTNLVAIARTVASVWRQERLAEEAAEIARLGKELHARLAVMGGHVARLGRNLELATGAYNAFVGSLESQVLTQAKRFEALEVSSGAREIEALPVIEAAPRPLTKLFPVEGDGQPN
ncbi:MAG TPA: DNA recombination protein RmuC [Allosphingosinicella sp.]|nr:DNA recombination protein RmuC [Allosphingosinicella sp.]